MDLWMAKDWKWVFPKRSFWFNVVYITLVLSKFKKRFNKTVTAFFDKHPIKNIRSYYGL